MAGYPAVEQLVDKLPGIESAELVQTGGQKAVYRAVHDGQTVALKVIAIGWPPVDEDNEGEDELASVVERVRREVSVQEQFHDPVFAGIGPLELQEITINDERWLCFTEEWIEGRLLTDMILDGPLSPQRLARLGLDLIHAVCLLSSRHFVHRDIKPANIMWGQRRDGFVLLDPGIALDQLGPSLTLGPMAVGTVAYQSPEQMDTSRKRSLDFRSDLFAVGLVLYEAAAARHPFMDNRATLSSVVAGILTRTPPSLAASIDTFPQELSNVIDRLLAKEPHLRYRTCERALAATAEASRLIGTTS